MSVSLKEVIEAAGYDLSTLEDAKWLLSKVSEFEQLVTDAEDFRDAEQDKIDAEMERAYAEAFPEEE